MQQLISGNIKRLFLEPKLFIGIFVVLNIIFFMNIYLFNRSVSFNSINYKVNAHHFFTDPRIEGGDFILTKALAQFDAQWYLTIAKDGYPKIEGELDSVVSKMTFAFFPLYPLIIKSSDLLLNNLELTALLVSLVFIIINYISIIYVIKKHFNYIIAIKTSFLIFFFPFAIFFRSYFTEGLYLFLLIWFSYYLFEKKYLKSSLFLAFLNVTKASGFLLNGLFVYLSLKDHLRGRLKNKELFGSYLLVAIPFVSWMFFNFYKTGSMFYFIKVRSFWSVNQLMSTPVLALFYNLLLTLHFPTLSLHTFHSSKVDILVLVIFLFLIMRSKKTLRDIYWFITVCLWLSPLLVTDTMSFSRYQSVNLPIFIYLASVLKGKGYIITFLFFFITFIVTSLFFINWWWVG